MEIGEVDNDTAHGINTDGRASSSLSGTNRSQSSIHARPSLASLPDRAPLMSINLSNLPPINTTANMRRSSSQRVSSWSSKRLSTMSTASPRSRPHSTVFPTFYSSPDYSLVRDFAYATTHPMHYGPPPEDPSSISTPASEFQRRLSDPQPTISWSRLAWPMQEPSSADAALGVGPQLPATSYREGPPYSEDDDLHSPIVTNSRQKKARSSPSEAGLSRSRDESSASQGWRTSYAGVNQDGGQVFYVDHIDEGLPDGPGGEFIDCPPQRSGWLRSQGSNYVPFNELGDASSPDVNEENEGDSRYSKDYSFTIASPDEEMHGKAVALFDFERENENELPLVEGQVLWVSYRHGQGWLVAQDPRSGESGLVPEEYVRLVRDIEGGLNGLNSQLADSDVESPQTETPTTNVRPSLRDRSISNHSDKYPSIVSHFSTSSRDLQPYPTHRFESRAETPMAQAESPSRHTTEELVERSVKSIEKERESLGPFGNHHRSASTRKAEV